MAEGSDGVTYRHLQCGRGKEGGSRGLGVRLRELGSVSRNPNPNAIALSCSGGQSSCCNEVVCKQASGGAMYLSPAAACLWMEIDSVACNPRLKGRMANSQAAYVPLEVHFGESYRALRSVNEIFTSDGKKKSF